MKTKDEELQSVSAPLARAGQASWQPSLNSCSSTSSSNNSEHRASRHAFFADGTDAVLSNGQVITVLDLKARFERPVEKQDPNIPNNSGSPLPARPFASSNGFIFKATGRTAASIQPGMELLLHLPMAETTDSKTWKVHVDKVLPWREWPVQFHEFQASCPVHLSN